MAGDNRMLIRGESLRSKEPKHLPIWADEKRALEAKLAQGGLTEADIQQTRIRISQIENELRLHRRKR